MTRWNDSDPPPFLDKALGRYWVDAQYTGLAQPRRVFKDNSAIAKAVAAARARIEVRAKAEADARAAAEAEASAKAAAAEAEASARAKVEEDAAERARRLAWAREPDIPEWQRPVIREHWYYAMLAKAVGDKFDCEQLLQCCDVNNRSFQT